MGQTFEEWLAELKGELERRRESVKVLAEAHHNDAEPIASRLGAVYMRMLDAEREIHHIEEVIAAVRTVTK